MEPRAEHAEWRVPAALTPYLASGTGYLLDGVAPGVHLGMPSGRLTLVVSLDEPLTVSRPDRPVAGGSGRQTLGSCLGGLHTHAVHIHHDGRQHGIQLALTPAGARALLGLPAGELAEQCLELADVLGPTAHRVRDDLHEIDSWTTRFDLLSDALTKRLAERAMDRRLGRAWSRIARSRGAVRIAEFAEEAGWSPRQLTDRFTREFGIRPKVACRVARFTAAQDLLSRGVAGAEAAARAGYADQAHLIRDWRALTGTTPTGWMREDGLAFVQSESRRRAGP